MLPTSSTSARSRCPIGLPPGSRVSTTSWPLLRIHSASAFAWVDFPAPSPPSSAMKKPVPVVRCGASGAPPRSERTSSRPSGRAPRWSSVFSSTTAASTRVSSPAVAIASAAPPWTKVKLPGLTSPNWTSP